MVDAEWRHLTAWRSRVHFLVGQLQYSALVCLHGQILALPMKNYKESTGATVLVGHLSL